MTDRTVETSSRATVSDTDSNESSRFITVGGPIDEASASLCLYGDDLDPEEVSSVLAMTPTHAHRKGDRIRSRSPDAPKDATYKTGAWILKIRGKAPQDPQALTLALLDQLPQDESLWAELAGRFDVRLGYGLHMEAWNRGFDLSQELVARIAGLRAVISFDIYANLDEE